MFIRFIVGFFIIILVQPLFGQVVINEVLSLNTSGITDEDQEYTDWIELFNTSDSTVNLDGYFLKDDMDDSIGWIFPEIEMAAQSHLLIFASGKDRKTYALNYHTIINKGDEWQYLVPDSLPDNSWRNPGYNASNWQTGQSGFGYGDGDDQTVINPLQAIFLRKEFTIDDLSAVQEILLHVDYDDGFVAFINGAPVAMENVYLPDDDYNNAQFSGSDHEASIYQGGEPSAYKINLSSVNLIEGTNVLALQGYNVSPTSSDFTLIPFLTIGSTNFSYSDVPDFIHVEEGGLHTNFKIKNEGEGLYLFKANNQIADSIWVVALPANKSFGRYPDGTSEWKYFNTPTPGTANANPLDELRNDSIFFSVPAGFYAGSITVELSTNVENLVIKYTMDGSDPTSESSNYDGAVAISKTTSLRAATFFNGEKSSNVFTKTYLIGTDHSLPVFSLTTDPYNLWDYNYGIYVLGPNAEPANPNFGANFWEDWERPIHVEYFDSEKQELLDQDAGIKITGAWSRANAQKSLALFARSKYGTGSFSAKLFKDLPFDKYESFILRNSGNDWSYSMIRDGLISEIAKPLNMDRLAFQPAVIYINGEYWGIQNLREKPNEHYFESHYNVDEDDLNLLELQYSPVHGSVDSYLLMINFINKNSLKDEDNYNQIKNQIDIDCFIDYELVQIYIYNGDWPGNNIKYWRSNKPSSKWRWLIYDTDFGFDIWNGSTYRNNGIAFATDPDNSGWPNPAWSTLLLRKLLVNQEFRFRFINRTADLLNTVLSIDSVLNKLDSVATIVQPEIFAHRERWGHTGSWENRIGTIQLFAKNRPMYMRQHFDDYFNINNYTVTLTVSNKDEGLIRLNTITPKDYPFKGYYFGGVPIKFTALPKPGFKFVRWENATSSSEPTITLNLTGNIKLNAVFEPVNGNEPVDVVINEINYKSTDDYDMGDWLELYNNGSITVDLSGYVITDQASVIKYLFPDETLLYPGDYLVVCDDLKKFREVYPYIINVIGNLSYGLSRKGEVISLVDKRNNLIDQVKYETSSPWPVEPFETAATLELMNPKLDNNLYTSWDAGPLGGTPGAPNQTRTSKKEFFVNAEDVTCFPTRFNDYTTISFQIYDNLNYSVSIFDVQGRLRNQVSGEFPTNGTYYLDIFTDQNKYPQGLYLVNVQVGSLTKTIKVVKL